MPDSMSFAKASGISTTYGTSYYALKQRADLKPGETLLVLGAAGGVGLAAVELGKAMGAKVIAAASSDEKLAAAKQAGADELIDYSDGELKDKVKARSPTDVAWTSSTIPWGVICSISACAPSPGTAGCW